MERACTFLPESMGHKGTQGTKVQGGISIKQSNANHKKKRIRATRWILRRAVFRKSRGAKRASGSLINRNARGSSQSVAE